MTRIFDLHADIGRELMEQKSKGEGISFADRHMKRLAAGGIQYSAAACFFTGPETWHEMKEMISLTAEQIRSHAGMILSPDDLKEDGDMAFLLTVEGMCGINAHIRKRITWMYEKGVRMASLTWNDFNLLATGLGGDPARGLSEEGRRAVKTMNSLHMIIDVSHANEHTFWDLINTSKRPLVASHSNCRKLCPHPRNLTDEQIIALAEKGGLIGMNSYSRFLSEDAENQNAAMLARHAAHIADIVGHTHVACGFDFMDFIHFLKEKEETDICNASMAQNFIEALRREGFSEEETEDIAWRNAFRFLKDNL